MTRLAQVIGLEGRRQAKIRAAEQLAAAQLLALMVEEQRTRGRWALGLQVAVVVARGLLLWARLRR